MSEAGGSPTVLIGISTRNRCDILPRALDSVLEQSYPHIRTAVWDDGSTDGTPAIRDRFPSVTWSRTEVGTGLIYARNHLMLGAGEDCYLSLDDDAWFMAGDEVSIAAHYLQQNTHVAAVAFDILTPDRPHSVPRGKILPVAMVIGCGHLVRLDLVKRLRGYASLPGTYGAEEKDLSLRLIDAGFEIHLLEGVHVWHDKTMVARDIPRQHRSGVCNDLSLSLMRSPLLAMPVFVGWKLISHLKFALSHKLLGPCLRGMGDFLAAFPKSFSARDPVRLSSLFRFSRLSRR